MAKEKKTENQVMENLISLAKRRGFIFQGSEIYGGLAGTWDYGPFGVALKNNIKNIWWKRFVTDRDDMYGMDAAILMNQTAWKASGHVAGFSDPLIECKKCKSRFRADHLDIDSKDFETVIKEFILQVDSIVNDVVKQVQPYQNLSDAFKKSLGKTSLEEKEKEQLIKTLTVLFPNFEQDIQNIKDKISTSKNLLDGLQKSTKYIGLITHIYLNRHVKCPNCNSVGQWLEPRQFNMMFKTNVGAIESDESVSYLRPETAQGMFVNFKNILDTFHPKLPFGMAQIGKAFRNEIAPRDFIFRVREFEQMEIEYFVDPKDWEKTFDHFVAQVHAFIADCGITKKLVSENEIAKDSLAHYSKRTIDFEFEYPFGKKELYGLAYRTDFDLKAHSDMSKVDLSYFDEEKKVRFIPHVIEPSFGVDRTVLAVLTSAYAEDELGGEKRVYLKLSPNVAPVKVAVFPLLKNKEVLTDKAQEIYKVLKGEFGAVMYDEAGSIGKRYRKQDEIGTPYCVTVDFDTVEKGIATVRDRDTGEQEKVKLDDLASYLAQKLGK